MAQVLEFILQRRDILILKKNTMEIVRKEVHTRCRFAQSEGLKWMKEMQFMVKVGNIMTSKATVNFLRCKAIYDYYNIEFLRCQELPLKKYRSSKPL